MENTENKNILSSIYETFTQTIVIMTIFNFLFKSMADEISQVSELFALCGEGITLEVIIQLLMMSIIISLLRWFWFSDKIFKNMMTLWRTTFMLGSSLITMFTFAIIFKWFPPDMWQAWVGGLVGFAVSTIGSFLVMFLKTKLESNEYQKSFDEYKNSKNEEENNNECN